MPNTKHAYEHVWGIYLPIAIGVFAIVIGTLLVLLVRGARNKEAGVRSKALPVEVVLCVRAGVHSGVSGGGDVPGRDPDRPARRAPGAAHQSDRRAVELALSSTQTEYQVTDISTWHPTPAYVPTGTEIEFEGTSEDVIHGFWVPELHYQRQVLPGYSTHFDLIFAGHRALSGRVLCPLR